MCSNYTLKITAKQLKESLSEIEDVGFDVIDGRFLPYQTAPVIVRPQNANLKVVPMNFSLVPHWSKTAKVKFATHNARIETVTEKPTWKIPFLKNHCVVPMSSFLEAVYEGPEAGHIIDFSENNNKQLFAAGLFDRWLEPESKKILHSFTILTTTPTVFIADHGHDRIPIFLNPHSVTEWLNVSHQSNRYWLDFLTENQNKPEFKVRIERPLKPGWEKRK